MRVDEYKKLIIAKVTERKEFIRCEDGFVRFDPNGPGWLSAEALRVIADELDRQNAGWVAEIDAYFAAQEKSRLNPDGSVKCSGCDGAGGEWFDTCSVCKGKGTVG